jgi:hypothetical protein
MRRGVESRGGLHPINTICRDIPVFNQLYESRNRRALLQARKRMANPYARSKHRVESLDRLHMCTVATADGGEVDMDTLFTFALLDTWRCVVCCRRPA